MRISVMCLRNLLRRRLRTSLCVLSVALATIFIVAIGANITNYTVVIREMNMFFDGDVVVVAEGAMVIQAFPVMGGDIPKSVLEKLQQVNGVRTTFPMLVRFGYQVKEVIQLAPSNVTIGVPVGNWSVLVGQTPLKPGGNWPATDPDNEGIIIGASLAAQHDITVGSTLRIRETNLTVAGILDTQSALLSRSVIFPLELAQSLYYGHDMWVGNMIVTRPEENVTEREIAEKIEAEVLGVRALTTSERDEIVEPLLQDIEIWNFGLSGMLYFLSMILVAIVALMNVSERRRDFATLDAIGAPRFSIFCMVILETMLIGLFGGLIGIVLGSIAAMFIASSYTNIPLSMFLSDLFTVVSPIFMVRILVSTVAVSCVAGIIPALIASKTNISEVLRSEY